MNFQKNLIQLKLFSNTKFFKYFPFIFFVETFVFVTLRLLIISLKSGETFLFDAVTTVVAAGSLFFAIFVFMRNRDNQVVATARPVGNSFRIKNNVVQKVEVEIQSQRRQTYLKEIKVADWFDTQTLIGFSLETAKKKTIEHNFLLSPLSSNLQFVLFLVYPEQNPDHFLNFSFLDGTCVELFVKCGTADCFTYEI